MPPEWMWPLTDELEDWFAEVEAKRKVKYGSSGDDDDGVAEDPPGGMVSNNLAAQRRA